MARLLGGLHSGKGHPRLPQRPRHSQSHRLYQQNAENRWSVLPHQLLPARTAHQHPEEMGREGVLISQNHHPRLCRNRRLKVLLRVRLHKMIPIRAISIPILSDYNNDIFEDGTVVHLRRAHPPTLTLASTHEHTTGREDLSESGDQRGVPPAYSIGPRTGCSVGHPAPTSINHRSIHTHPR